MLFHSLQSGGYNRVKARFHAVVSDGIAEGQRETEERMM